MFYLAYTTSNDIHWCEEAARELLKNRLAGCVQILPAAQSFYVWEDQVQEDSEWRLLIKTHASTLEAVEKWILKHHRYDVPCFLSWPVAASKAYGNWLESEVGIKNPTNS